MADRLAGAVLCARRFRRTLLAMAVTERAVQEDAERKALVLRQDIIGGSSWSALCLSLQARPLDLPELLKAVGVYELRGVGRRRAFDACVDGYTVFHDARTHGRI